MKRRFGTESWVPILMLVCLSASVFAQKREPDIFFAPTPQKVVEAMLEMAGVNEKDVVYDLGCGDGRFVITAARTFGARGVGVDIDPQRVEESTRNAEEQGVSNRVRFIEDDFFETDIREATVVTLYLLSELNLKLRLKLLSELRPGSRVLSYAFDMGDWKPDKEARDQEDGLYYWVIPAKVAGTWQWSLDGPDGKQPYRLQLEQRYQEIKGAVRFENREARFLEPKLEGDQVSFAVISEVRGQAVHMKFNGRVSGDTITGSVDIQGSSFTGTQVWSATRIRTSSRGFAASP
jgi:SAM-dependent methyltransferase